MDIKIGGKNRRSELELAKAGNFQGKSVSKDEFAGIRARFKLSCDKINQIDLKNRSLGLRIWEWLWGMSDEKKGIFANVKGDLEKRGLIGEKEGVVNGIVKKLENNEYLDTKEAKELKKMILIKQQIDLGVVEAAKKTEAFYRFDAVVEEKSKEDFEAFEGQIKELGLGKELKSMVNFVKKKIEHYQNFSDEEIELVRENILAALKNKKRNEDNEGKIKDLTSDKKKLNMEKEEVQKKNKNLRLENKGVRQLYDQLIKDDGKLKDEYNDLKYLKERIDSDLKGKEVDYEKLGEQLRAREFEFDREKKAKEELQRNYDNLKQKNGELENKNRQLINIESEYRLYKDKTSDYEELKNELFGIKQTVGSLEERTQELKEIEEHLVESEKTFETKQKRNEELGKTIEEGTRKLEKLQDQMNDVRSATALFYNLGHVMGATREEPLEEKYRLDLGEEKERTVLLNKEKLNEDEAKQLQGLTFTLMKELEFEEELKKRVPNEMVNLRGEYEAAEKKENVDRYLKGLKDRIIMEGYPGLVKSDEDPRVFVFFVNGELLKITVDSEESMEDLQVELDHCRIKAQTYKRVEEQVNKELEEKERVDLEK